MTTTPEDLRYTAEHEWVRGPDSAGTVRIGITDFAQGELGDIVFAELPEVGTELDAGSTCGELESTKSVSDVYAPVTGASRRSTRPSRPPPSSSTPTRTARAGCSRSGSRTRLSTGDLMDAATYAGTTSS